MRHGYESAYWREAAASQLKDYQMKFSPEKRAIYLRETKPEWLAKLLPGQVLTLTNSNLIRGSLAWLLV